MIIPESIITKKKNNEIPSIFHNGFADTGFQAVKEFLNYYNIPFSPLEYFGYEMTNPLFLTLYCKNYTGSETSLPQLYERLIESVNIKLHHSLHLSQKGYTEDINILKPLIMEIASVLISSKRRCITENEIECLNYWRKFNLQSSIVIHHLKGEGILHTHVFNGQEELFFSFDQMNDYFGAEAILKRDCSKEEMRCYLSTELLGIKNGNLENYNNIEIFINCCALFAEKFREECIDIINSVLDEEDRSTIFSYYLESFQWRTSIYLSSEEFNSLCQKCCFRCEDIWRMLINNSVRTNHLFNADFLHNVLSTYSLCERDYLWTIYINGLPSNDNERIVQLVNLYNEGSNLDFRHPKQIELLLTVLGWLLTSSNRWLRDVTSKAMIEILKEHFQYCKVLISKFKDVNDPYVVQRLYGIILGACCKRIHSEDNLYQDLAEYIYCNVFEQEIVYEDILLRDYARLLIERFLNEYPNYCGIIKKRRITPPYTSIPIPEIEDQHYLDKEFSGAIRCIISSMRFDGMGWYGDFGRYVFQRALNSFDVNEYQIFNYAVFHIINEIGFSEEFFNDYDTFSRGYDRGRTIKTERIGKKYQWITMYHVLARISDNCVMKETWQSTSDSSIKYEGPWEPYIRDFDPTLNQNFLDLRDAPSFPLLDEYRAKSIADHKMEDISAEFKQQVWINKKSYFLEHLQDSLAISDKYGTQWVFLTKYCDTDRHNIEVDKLHEWSWLYAYFMTPSQIDSCNEQLKKGRSLLSSEITSLLHTYTIYNREYPWSPSCHCITNDTWINYSIGTGEYEEIPVNSDSSFDDSIYKQLLAIYSADNEDDSEEKTGEADMHQTINRRTRSKEIVKDIGCILASTIELLWEEEYDASKESAISICHPCPKFIEDMKLTQKQDDGAYYDTSNKIAAFDTNLSQGLTGVMVRKDILDRFLAMNELRLVWFVDAEKAVHADGYMISMLSRWEGMLLYNKGSIEGDIYIRSLDTGKTKHAQDAPSEGEG